MRADCCVGVMSGTSLDGVDAVVACFEGDDKCLVQGSAYRPFPAGLRSELLALQAPGSHELARAARAANELADTYADTIADALAAAGVSAADVKAAGVHGQTIRHDARGGWTLQLNNAARVAERSGITIVADFRARDIAAGGQGAPLVPAFHAALFGRQERARAIVNVGGIANVTVLPAGRDVTAVRGFDTGPGNVLLDLWCARHRGTLFDRDGEWAEMGKVDAKLLALLLAEPYFAAPPPKSTGRDLFNGEWLEAKLVARADEEESLSAVDVQATLLALTARTMADAIRTHASDDSEVLVCGGGANNAALMTALSRELAPKPVATTAQYGVAVEHVEALAFAWLARQALAGQPGNLPAVTGARGLRVLGAIYPK
jgi:anhydro-N-acetylmuramic acid kinase